MFGSTLALAAITEKQTQLAASFNCDGPKACGYCRADIGRDFREWLQQQEPFEASLEFHRSLIFREEFFFDDLGDSA